MEGEQAGRWVQVWCSCPSYKASNTFFPDQMTWPHEKVLDSHCRDVKMLGCENIQSQHEKGGVCASWGPALLLPPRGD